MVLWLVRSGCGGDIPGILLPTSSFLFFAIILGLWPQAAVLLDFRGEPIAIMVTQAS